jgi:hypothetical protein
MSNLHETLDEITRDKLNVPDPLKVPSDNTLSLATLINLHAALCPQTSPRVNLGYTSHLKLSSENAP